jgi:hypothetical protein
MASVGCAYTVVRGARSKDEFLRGLRQGYGRVRGETGGIWKLTREVLSIGWQMVLHNPSTAVLLPLAVAAPLVTSGNYIHEALFARYWMKRYERTRMVKGTGCAAGAPVAEAAA